MCSQNFFGKKQQQKPLEIAKISSFGARTTLESSSKIGQKSTLDFDHFWTKNDIFFLEKMLILGMLLGIKLSDIAKMHPWYLKINPSSSWSSPKTTLLHRLHLLCDQIWDSMFFCGGGGGGEIRFLSLL